MREEYKSPDVSMIDDDEVRPFRRVDKQGQKFDKSAYDQPNIRTWSG